MRSCPVSPALKFNERDMSCTPQVFANCFILPIYFRFDQDTFLAPGGPPVAN